MIRLNQIKDQKSELEAHVLADLQEPAVASGDGQDGLEFTLLKFMEGLHHRLGSGAVGSNGLWDGQGGSSGVVASFSADDAINRVVINQGFGSADSGLDITSSGQGPSDTVPALKIEASDAAAYMYIKSNHEMELEATDLLLVDAKDALTETIGGNHTKTLTGNYVATTGGTYSQIGDNTMLFQSSLETVEIDAAADAKDLKLSAGSTAEAAINLRYDSGADARSEIEVASSHIQLWNGDSTTPADILDIDASDMNLDGATFDLTLSGAENHDITGTCTFTVTQGFSVQGSAGIDMDAVSDITIDGDAAIKVKADNGDSEYAHGDLATALQAGQRYEGPALDLQSTLSACLLAGIADNGDFAAINNGNMIISANFENTTDDMVSNGSLASEMTSGANEYLAADFDQLQNVQGLIFGDAHCVASNWSIEGIPLAVHTGEWNEFKNAFGEVSLLNAMAQAGAGAADAGVYQISVSGDIPVASDLFEEGAVGNEYAGAAFHGSASAIQIDGAEPSSAASIAIAANTDFDEMMERLEVFANGQRLLPSYYDVATTAVVPQDFTVRLVESDDSIVTLANSSTRTSKEAKLLIDVLFDLEASDELVVIMK